MERLTIRSGFTNEVYLTGKADTCWANRPIKDRAFCVGCHRHKGMDRTNCGALMLVDRLAAYEDTGLEPENIIPAADMAKIACALHEFNVYKKLDSLDRLRELAEADREGRCVVLPCKVEDDVYINIFGRTLPFTVISISQMASTPTFKAQHGIRLVYIFKADDVGETVFMTREEAEAALATDC